MKTKFLAPCVLFAAFCAAGQGTTLFYDQQSSTDETPLPYGTGGSLQGSSPGAGQSFTPGLAGVDFVKFMLIDGNPTDGLGTTISVNLRSGSISGPVLGSTAPVTTPDGFHGAATFLFPAEVPVSPGTQYYFEVVPQSGGSMNIFGTSYSYSGGVSYANGHPRPGSVLWFCEGIIVPEPSSAAFLLVAAGTLWLLRRRRLQ